MRGFNVSVSVLSAMFACGMAFPSLAEDAPKSTLPDIMACPQELNGLATCYSVKQESGAYVVAAKPNTWNHTLIVFSHGGPSMDAPQLEGSRKDLARYAVDIKRGFAFVASSYRREGYGVRMSVEDTDSARQFFVDHVAKPEHTLIHGASYGAMVALKLIDTYGDAKDANGKRLYDGAFLTSGLVIGAPLGYEFRADLAAVYQYYCKNLPRPDEAQYPLWLGLPTDSTMTVKEVYARVYACTGVNLPAAQRSAQQKRNLANILGVMDIPEGVLARHMEAVTFLFRDWGQHITGGKSAFSNIGVRYKGSDDDAALNAGVARFAADPAALAAMKADGQVSGNLPIPMVSVHSINDPRIAVEVQADYRAMVDKAGHGANLVQAYTDEPLHTGQSAPEIAAALDGLMAWIESGTKPSPDSIAQSCKSLQAALDGPCRYHPKFQPKPYATKFYPRQEAAR